MNQQIDGAAECEDSARRANFRTHWDEVLLMQKMHPEVLEAINTIGDYECAKGYLRYELMRTLSPSVLRDLADRSIKGERIDDMVDALCVTRLEVLKSVKP